MEYSLPGFLGAFVGVVIGVANYIATIPMVVRALRRLDRSQTQEERDDFERRLSLMRRIVLGADIAVFAAIGYMIGRFVGG